MIAPCMPFTSPLFTVCLTQRDSCLSCTGILITSCLGMLKISWNTVTKVRWGLSIAKLGRCYTRSAFIVTFRSAIGSSMPTLSTLGLWSIEVVASISLASTLGGQGYIASAHACQSIIRVKACTCRTCLEARSTVMLSIREPSNRAYSFTRIRARSNRQICVTW